MSRIKRLSLAAVLLMLVLSLAAAEGEGTLIAPEDIRPQDSNYKTYEVTPSTWELTFSLGGSEFYPVTAYAVYEGLTARFVEYKVSRGDTVKAGDVLAEVEITASTVDITTLELNLSRARDEYETGKAKWERDLTEARLSLGTTQGEDRQIQALRLQRSELAYQQYCLQREYEIESLERDLKERREQVEKSVLVSPIDGVVYEVQYMRVGEQVYPGMRLITVYDPSRMLIAVDNSTGRLRYNMDVTVEMGAAKQRETVSGRVVAADNMLPDGKRLGKAFVALEAGAMDMSFKNPKVQGSYVHVPGALVLPRSTATLQGGSYYIYKLQDGMAQKRFVNAVVSNATGVWVIQGLDEGDLVILD